MAENSDPPDRAEPPGPPEAPRRVRLYRGQWIGIPLLMLLPLLALFAAFDERRDLVDATIGDVRVEVDYPRRVRAGQRTSIELRVESSAAATASDTISIAFEPRFFRRLVDVTFTPAPAHAFEVQLVALEPGRPRGASIELEFASPWRHTARIDVVRGGTDTARVQLHTFVLP